jgi:signal peptidase I
MVRELVETVLVCVVFVLFLRAFVFQQSEIPSASMETTILIGDHVLVNRFIYAPTSFAWERHLLPIRNIRRGDIVVFKHPPGPEQDFIKRVVGLPGETIALRNGTLLVNGVPVDEPYLDEAERFGTPRVDQGPRVHDPLLDERRPTPRPNARPGDRQVAGAQAVQHGLPITVGTLVFARALTGDRGGSVCPLRPRSL